MSKNDKSDIAFELVEIRENGSAKTFVYRNPDEVDKPVSLWSKFIGKAK